MKSNSHSTQTIWDMIEGGATPDELEPVIGGDMTFSSFINDYLSNHPELTAAQITRNANMSKSSANDIINGKKRGGRDKIIALCYAAHMTVKETRHALTYSGNDDFYPQRKRDMYIIYAFNNQKKYPTITDVNLYLSENGEEPLQTSKKEF